jgi:hypothetical protein
MRLSADHRPPRALPLRWLVHEIVNIRRALDRMSPSELDTLAAHAADMSSSYEARVLLELVRAERARRAAV